MTNLRPLLVFFLLSLSAVLVGAQVIVVRSGQAGGGVGTSYVGGMTGGNFTYAGNAGLPFSADVVEENDKFLADGNHIHYEVHGKFFRDSEGRIRTETEAPVFTSDSKPFVHINITDLVEGRIIFLDMEHKIATVTLLKQPTAQAAIASPKNSADQNPKVQPQPTTRVHRSAPPTPDPAPEDLGTSQIEGFAVQGTRSTHIMNAGVIGNDQPIATTTERWFSTEFKVDLVNISDNPEAGKHVRKLINIHAGEPDPLLFQVPPDFKVREMPQQ
ncbi:MAG: hypothetical protein WCG81_08380 [Candidatus Angelobacter sp.]